MSTIYKFVEHKNDGWFFNEESADCGKGIYEPDSFLWNKITLSLSTWSDWSEATTKEEREVQIRKAFELEIEAERERFEYDLKHNIKIYPLIKKKEVLNNG